MRKTGRNNEVKHTGIKRKERNKDRMFERRNVELDEQRNDRKRGTAGFDDSWIPWG